MENTTLQKLFAADPQRFEHFHLHLDGLLADYSKQAITQKTLDRLIDLAKAANVEGWRDRMLKGEAINQSETRAALHMALRGNTVDKDLEIEGENVAGFVANALKQIETLSDKIRGDRNITDVVNLGIGGSDLGPKMVCRALENSADGPRVHFISNIDAAPFEHLLKTLKPQNTIFIIASKTFTTLETLTNAKKAKDWLGDKDMAAHLIAITANAEAAQNFGVKGDQILPLRDWIGGRFSLWSAIGLTIAIANGFAAFKDLLAGAGTMDAHFTQAPLARNMPVILGLIDLWNRNFMGRSALAILPYAQNLELFPAYLQQLIMESAGKNMDRDGQMIDYATASAIFGETGTNAQHSFMQMLHQGPDIIPADFILTAQTGHKQLLANALAQSEALMAGCTDTKAPHKTLPGNRPSTSLVLDRLDAYHLGMLAALYEHKVFVQSIIWRINPFDQWGVEHGKALAARFIQSLEKTKKINTLNSSTAGLIQHIDTRFIKS